MPQNNLFLTLDPQAQAEYQRILQDTVKAVIASMDHADAYAGMTPDELKTIVRSHDLLPENGLGFDEVLKRVESVILPNLLRPSSTGYMAHLHSAALLESIAAELIIATFNQSMDSWDQSPVATEIEVDVIQKLCAMYGYDENSDGVFTSGGSQSNFSAILLARDWFCNKKLNWDVKKYGLPDCFRKIKLYTSEISHFSMEKSMHMLGFGYESVVKVPTDSRKRMDCSKLKELIEKDLADGNLPFCVVVTVGTTDYGSIDPIAQITELCHRYGMWVHADAAYGSGVVLSRNYINRIAGLQDCDSITVDFHKMFMLPISCSASLVKDGSTFDALTLHADYLNREEDEEDGYTNLVNKSVQTTRRFDALKVWMSFQTRGKKGWTTLIDTCIENAAYLYRKLSDSRDFEVVTEPEISSVVFRIKSLSDTESHDDVNKRIRRTLLHKHGIVIGQTICDGDVYLKFTLLNPLITHERLDTLMALLLSLREQD